MKPEKTDTDWRSRYLDALRSLEEDTQRFRAMEVVLKRLAGRLCIATRGLSPLLDSEIDKLRRLLKHDVKVDELEQLMPSLTTAINALDDPAPHGNATSPGSAIAAAGAAGTPGTSRPTAPGSDLLDADKLRPVLRNLLAELKRDDVLGNLVNTLDTDLKEPLTSDNLTSVLATVSDMITLRIQRAERARQEAEHLLNHMAGRLDDISQYVSAQSQNQVQSRASSHSLNEHLTGEMQAMGASVDNASDLQQLRTQVRARLDAIDHHLQDFRQREAARDRDNMARTEQMQSRMRELEAEAVRLQHQLKAEQEVSQQDALTRLPNRLAYDRRLEEELNRFARHAQPCCLAAVDIDHFKQVNDTWGHRAGDRVLQVVANRLRKRMRNTDFVARYGGEEFVIVLPDTDLTTGLSLLDALRETVSQLGFHFRGTPITVSISGGITALRTGDTPDSVFERADQALYRAKHDGRNRCVAG